MKIDYQKVNKKNIEKLILDKNMNIAAADALFEFSFYSEKNKIDVNDYLSEVVKYLELNLDDKEDRYFLDTRIIKAIKKIDVRDYQDNFYRNNIKPKEFKNKEYQLTYLSFKPYQCFPYDDILVDSNFVEVSQIGYFDKPFSYLAVLKDDVVWMSTDPNEINTMKKPISEAKGHVLAFGLGLGYFPVMTALKDNVKDVTVVEYDSKIIEIFNRHILPLVPFQDKIHVVQADAFEFAKRDLNKDFDYLFIDIWHNPEDGLPMYLKLKRLLRNKKLTISYWLEKSILAMYRRCLLTIIEENMMGYTKKDYLKAKTEYDQIINDLYFKTENMSFSSISEIKDLLQDKELEKLI